MDGSLTAESRFGAQRTARFHRWRRIKDSLAKWVIAIGGVTVIWAVVLILFYLAWVVFPLFLPAEVSSRTLDVRLGSSGASTQHLAVDEQLQVITALDDSGAVRFIDLETGERVESDVATPAFGRILASEPAVGDRSVIGVLAQDGAVGFWRQEYVTDYQDGVADRRVVPRWVPAIGDARLPLLETAEAPVDFAVSVDDDSLVAAALTAGGELAVGRGRLETNFLTETTTMVPERLDLSAPAGATRVSISGDQRWLYVGDREGRVHQLSLADGATVESVAVTDAPITSLEMLLGGISVLAGSEQGALAQLFPVRDADNQFPLRLIRSFSALDGAIRDIVVEPRRKGFVALTDAGELGIYHSTADRRVWSGDVGAVANLAMAPRANGLLLLRPDGQITQLQIDNDHPEISFASLWQKVWYENYQEPEYVWQSSSASNDFEPKFSLTPLAFGTLKAALYAMLFAVPLALTGAAYTAYFMSPGLRRMVKPTIEIMAALPTVILGFLAGLWFAPWLEDHLAGVFAVLLVLPLVTVAFGWLWQHPLARWREKTPEGWEPAILVPVVIAAVMLALWIAAPLENWWFDGDLRSYISQDLGISYDQRNALVVGVAMGFAVIPTIFSLAEDAVFGVPKSLSDGSLALGATPWQSLVRVVLPTASPGIFSALMIGLGRAVGETMIVLMATGNTPIMDWNMFEGMRTLSANIAVEMPESEVGGSHYRILFLAALVLFLFTFIVNTVAEIVRQRLRDKYSAI